MKGEHCETCTTSRDWARRQPLLVRLDEVLHRFDCRHDLLHRRFVWRLRSAFCDYIDVKFHGIDRVSNPRKG